MDPPRFRWQPHASPSGLARCSVAQAVSTLNVGSLRNLAFGVAGGGGVSVKHTRGPWEAYVWETAQLKDESGCALDSSQRFGKLAQMVPPSTISALPTRTPRNSPLWLLTSLAQLAVPRPSTAADEGDVLGVTGNCATSP